MSTTTDTRACYNDQCRVIAFEPLTDLTSKCPGCGSHDEAPTAPRWIRPYHNGRGTFTAHAVTADWGTVAVCGHRVGGTGLVTAARPGADHCKRCAKVTGTTP